MKYIDFEDFQNVLKAVDDDTAADIENALNREGDQEAVKAAFLGKVILNAIEEALNPTHFYCGQCGKHLHIDFADGEVEGDEGNCRACAHEMRVEYEIEMRSRD